MSATSGQVVLRLEYNGVCIKECAVEELPNETRIGRAQDCFWRIPDSDRSASSHHAILRRKGKRVFISDDDSRNGMYYKGVSIRERKLSDGDIIGIGDSKLLVEIASVKDGPKVEFHSLEQLGGDAKGKTFQLKTAVTRIGSGRECEIRIADSLVSHVHALFEVRADGYCYVRDNSSRNGIKINGVRQSDEAALTGQMLKDGDIVSVAYVDFRFWDRNVQHVRANIAQKIIIVIATLAIALGGYFGVQTLYPSAKALRLKAERLAAAARFEEAKALARESADARGAELDSDQRGDFIRRLEIWEETFNSWNGIKASLSSDSPNLWSVNAMFARLISSDDENWKWNASDAIVEMARAKATHSMLSKYLSGVERLSRNDADRDSFAGLAAEAEFELVSTTDAQPYQGKIRECLSDLASEFRRVSDETGRIKAVLDGYATIDATDDVLAEVVEIEQKSAQRVNERRKAGLPVSPLTAQMCKNVERPLGELQRSLRCLENNYAAVAGMRFEDFMIELPVPRTDDCIAEPNLTSRRADILAQNDLLRKAILQLKSFVMHLESDGILKTESGSPPPAFAVLFDDAIVSKALDCDCFASPPPGYTSMSPTSAYDKLLGVNVFYNYLSSIDGEFDSSILEERFVPGLFRAVATFKTVEQFVSFCNPAGNTPYAAVMKRIFASNPADAALKREVDSVKELIARRDLLLRKIDDIAMTNTGTRKGVLAAGLTYCLREGYLSSEEAESARRELFSSFTAVRRKTNDILKSAEGKGPDARMAVERAVLRVGIPGDPLLRQPWSDQTSGGGIR